jgi:YesN/AraC family two-component response regulator
MTKVVTSKVIDMIFSERVIIHELEEDSLVILLMFGFEDDTQIEAAVTNITKEVYSILLKNNNIHTTFSVGNPYTTLLDVCRSFNEAREAAEYKKNKKEDITVWYSKLPQDINYYFYPIDMENKLINLVKAGEGGEAETLLDELYNENFIKRNICNEMVRHFFYELKGTYLKILSLLRLDNSSFTELIKRKIKGLDKIKSVYEQWIEIRQINTEICSKVVQDKQKYVIQLKDKILDYINSEYKNNQLSLTLVAAHFNLSEVYLSRFFKEHTGENFSQYLEHMRLKNAKALMYESDYSIGEISEMMGYTSVNTFRRAYKRLYGIIPSKDRA